MLIGKSEIVNVLLNFAVLVDILDLLQISIAVVLVVKL